MLLFHLLVSQQFQQNIEKAHIGDSISYSRTTLFAPDWEILYVVIDWKTEGNKVVNKMGQGISSSINPKEDSFLPNLKPIMLTSSWKLHINSEQGTPRTVRTIIIE